MLFRRRTRNNEAKKLPKPIREHMGHRFNFLPEYLEMLRCFEYDGLVNEKRVKCIRIFSPDKTREQHLSMRSNLDLKQHPEMLLFECFIDNQGSIHVVDRRASHS